MTRSDQKFLPGVLYLIQPVLVATAPIISIYATNMDIVSISDVVRPLIAAAGLAVLLWALFYWVSAKPVTAAVESSAIMVLFWVFEGVLILASSGIWAIVGAELVHKLAALALFLGFLAVIFVFRRPLWASVTWSRSKMRSAVPILGQLINVVVAVAIAVPIVTIVSSFWTEAAPPGNSARGGGSRMPLADNGLKRLPNIYLIILDAYGRDDELQAHFAMDDALGRRLKRLGFYVAENSRSNYSTTIHSVSSILNFNYIHNIFSKEKIKNLKKSDFKIIVRENNIIRTLRSFGYDFVSYSSNYYITDCSGELYCIEGPSDFTPFGLNLDLNIFENFLLSRTFLHRVFRYLSISSPYLNHRERIKNTISGLPEHASSEFPNFVFAHLVVPHEPFVFGENGEDVSPKNLPFDFSRILNEDNPPRAPGTVDPDYARRYRAQATYVTKLVADAVKKILSRSSQPPIIIVQGDHGPYGFSPDVRRPRFAILNAYYLPDGGARLLYPGITPVNSFRVVFNYYFGARLKLLPDESYQTNYRILGNFRKVVRIIDSAANTHSNDLRLIPLIQPH